MNVDNVKTILENPTLFRWSLQGFGMFRLYLGDRVRLHLWDSDFAAPEVSTIHDHPWHFKSVILAGRITNQRYVRNAHSAVAPNHLVQRIQCGEGGGLVGDPEPVALLMASSPEIYSAGDSYEQHAEELHTVVPLQGTVSLIVRDFTEDTEHAHVCWPIDAEWGTAEPRPATDDEIKRACDRSLERWFK